MYLNANTIFVEVTTDLPRSAVALTFPPASFTDMHTFGCKVRRLFLICSRSKAMF
jgi:hypothetical protein